MDKQSNISAVPPYEQHPGAAPSPMATGHQPAGYPNPPAGSPPPMDQAHPYGQPAYGAPSPPSQIDPYHSPAHSPPAQHSYGNPIDQHQQHQQPIQPAPTGQYQQAGVTSPVNEKHEYYAQGQQPPQGAPAYTQQPGVVPGAGGIPMVAQPAMAPVTPLASLQNAPAWVQCPACHQIAMTAVEFHSGNTTHAMAVLFCCFSFLCCIPYFIRQLKDAEHKCGKCGTMLAVHHCSGNTRVLAHSG